MATPSHSLRHLIVLLVAMGKLQLTLSLLEGESDLAIDRRRRSVRPANWLSRRPLGNNAMPASDSVRIVPLGGKAGDEGAETAYRQYDGDVTRRGAEAETERGSTQYNLRKGTERFKEEEEEEEEGYPPTREQLRVAEEACLDLDWVVAQADGGGIQAWGGVPKIPNTKRPRYQDNWIKYYRDGGGIQARSPLGVGFPLRYQNTKTKILRLDIDTDGLWGCVYGFELERFEEVKKEKRTMEGRRWNRRVGWQIRAARNGGGQSWSRGAKESERREEKMRGWGASPQCNTKRLEIGRERRTRVTLSGCEGQYRNGGAEHGHHIVATIGGSVSVGVESWNWGALWTIIQECNANLASSMGEVVHAKEKEDQSREQTTGFRVARPEVLAPYTAAPGNAERRLGDRNAESAL
ncbi:hypothetical protein B0H14DRAFT_2570861 [Mycena olivaceomarginata]|nr:hypothetical protein B0H14DRAFT_2570861 [Mycena olivaceomarginata]